METTSSFSDLYAAHRKPGHRYMGNKLHLSITLNAVNHISAGHASGITGHLLAFRARCHHPVGSCCQRANRHDTKTPVFHPHCKPG